MNSPFSPGSDTVPLIWAGRVEQLGDWRDVVRPRRMAGLAERGRTILGEAGLGKSTLVRRIAQNATGMGDWVTPQLRIPSGADPLKLVATALLRLAAKAGLPAFREKRISEILKHVATVAASGFSLTVRQQDGPEPYTALTELLVEIGRAAVNRGDVAVLVHIDEVQNIADEDVLSQLLIALGDAITHEIKVPAPGGVLISRSLPIAVFLTGLPDFADKAGAKKGATFARRFKTTTLGPIGNDDLALALQPFVTEGWEVHDETGGTTRIRMEAEARDAILELCCGEPFLFQLAGEQAWYFGSSDIITRGHVLAGWERVRSEAATHVDRTLGRLPGREREFLEVMSQVEPKNRMLSRIADRMGHSKASGAGPTWQRLDTVRGIIQRGKPHTFRHRAVEAYLTSDWPDVSYVSRPPSPSTDKGLDEPVGA